MGCVNAVPDPADFPEVPEFVQHWVRQLLDPALIAVLRAGDERQVSVTLVANKARVRRLPVVVIGGNQEVGDVG